MDKYMLYCFLAMSIVNQSLIPSERVRGKSVLLVGENDVKLSLEGKNQASAEILHTYLMEAGARECMVFNPTLHGMSNPSEGCYGGALEDIRWIIGKDRMFDVVVLLEGMERERSIHQALAELRSSVRPNGVMYLVARTPIDWIRMPFHIISGYDDFWRFTAEDMEALFPDDSVASRHLELEGEEIWLFSQIDCLGTGTIGDIPLYSCRAGDRVQERDLREFGYFRKHTLNAIGTACRTDKSSDVNHYLDAYEHFLSPWKDDVFTLLELGVCQGSSLQMWKEYFQEARIVGADIDPNCERFEERRVHIEILDLGAEENLEKLKVFAPRLIIDDASHLWSHQIKALFTLYEVLPSGGIYILEDLGTSLNPEEFYGCNDFSVDAYTVCERIARVAAGRLPCPDDVPFADEITRIGRATEMVSMIRGSCIFVKW